jgi:hypothetical protein
MAVANDAYARPDTGYWVRHGLIGGVIGAVAMMMFEMAGVLFGLGVAAVPALWRSAFWLVMAGAVFGVALCARRPARCGVTASAGAGATPSERKDRLAHVPCVCRVTRHGPPRR